MARSGIPHPTPRIGPQSAFAGRHPDEGCHSARRFARPRQRRANARQRQRFYHFRARGPTVRASERGFPEPRHPEGPGVAPPSRCRLVGFESGINRQTGLFGVFEFSPQPWTSLLSGGSERGNALDTGLRPCVAFAPKRAGYSQPCEIKNVSLTLARDLSEDPDRVTTAKATAVQGWVGRYH